ncbi:acyltransferase [Clostridium sp. L74]|uniref:acyltransferase n=1 Tax=Clostridium sp. L74 TaxID=1560217 RepID=UPI0006ABAD22|nr:acyltransferase [Clostridium sp. L74]KOR25403.1 hypothetical protein ND00_17090 [Clostridium sp. L74]
MRKQRILELDVLRALAFIFVVIQHTLGGYSNSKMASYNDMLLLKFIYEIAKSAVPLFLTITGIVLFYSNYNNFSIKEYYSKKFTYIFLPYVIWSAICLIMLNKLNRFNDFFMQILSGNCCYHLWYMALLLRILIYFPLILILAKYIMKKNKVIKSSFFILFFILYQWILKNNHLFTKQICSIIFKNPSKLQERFINVTPILWSIYFVLGIYIIFNYNKFKQFILTNTKIIYFIYIISLIYLYYNTIKDKIGNPLPFIKYNTSLSILAKIISIIFFYLVSLKIINLEGKLYKMLRFIAKYSFPAYLCHIIVIQKICGELAKYIHPSNCLLYSAILCLLTIFISTFICYFINFFPINKYILGIKSRNQLPLSVNKIKTKIYSFYS